jgi:hypothetical protein
MILKKHISILLTFFLLVSNLGLAFNIHYCDDKIESISLKISTCSQGEVDECCGIVEKDSQCCKDKIIKSEIKSDQIIAKTVTFDTNFTLADYYSKAEVTVLNCNSKIGGNNTYLCDANARPMYLMYSQYTFYD